MASQPIHIDIEKGKKIYFLSDFHLRDATSHIQTDEREKYIVNMIGDMQKDAAAFFFLGDIFDRYIEYKKFIPKGFVRLQSKWLELKDNNIPVYFFRGNHDYWIMDYFKTYFGIHCFAKPTKVVCNGKNMLVGHGDGLGACGWEYKVFRFLITNPATCQVGRFIHPTWIYWFTDMFLRTRENQDDLKMYEDHQEFLLQYAKKYATTIDTEIDYIVFGHRHIPVVYKISPKSTYINTGNWIGFEYCYAQFDGDNMTLHYQKKSTAR